MKLPMIQVYNFSYPLICLFGVSIVCSCTTTQNTQSLYSKKTKLNEFYSNQSVEMWSSATTTNGTVACKEFLEILSSMSRPVQEATSKYGYPDFIRLVEKRPEASNVSFGDLIAGMPFYRLTMLYHSNTNLIVFINQETGNILPYKWQEEKIIKLMDENPKRKNLNLKEMREDTDFKIPLRAPEDGSLFWGPSELVDIYYQRKVEKDRLKEQARVKQEEQERVIEQNNERERRKSLPPDIEIQNLLIGYWEYKQQAADMDLSEDSVIEYKQDQTFNIKGKMSALGQVTTLVYSGIWDVKEGKVYRTVKAVIAAGQIRVMTPLGLLPQACIKVGDKDTDVIQSVSEKRIEHVKNETRKCNKVLLRLASKPVDTSRPDIQKLNVLKERAKAVKDKTLVLKAFYLGMPIEDAAALVANYLAGFSESSQVLSIEEFSEGKWFIDADSGSRVAADGDGKVTAFYFPRKAVEKLFDSKDVDVKAFIQTFQTAYSLPSFSFQSLPLEWFSKNTLFGKTQGIQPIASKLGFQEKWIATTDSGVSVAVYGAPTVFEEQKLRELVMTDACETIPSGSLLIRKINKSAFD